MMNLIPIDEDETQNNWFHEIPECRPVLDIFTGHYKKVGFNKPWIAYFVTDGGHEIIGGGGFKGRPTDGRVEISYGTFKKYEGRGIGTEICRQLIALAMQTDPSLTIVARTLSENEASIRILQRNGFVCQGTVHDEEDGEVLEWALLGEAPKPS